MLCPVLRETPLPSAFLNTFILPDQIPFLKVGLFVIYLLCVLYAKLLRFECTPGQMVYTVRQRCGRQLAIEAPTDVDLVSTVPESATPAALGYAQQVCPSSHTRKRRCNVCTPSNLP